LRIDSGDTVHFDLLMCGDGQLERGMPYADTRLNFDTLYNLAGPVWVNGALPGDTLEVEILALEPGDWGWTVVLPELGLLPEDFPEPFMRYFDLTERSTIDVLPGVRVPIRRTSRDSPATGCPTRRSRRGCSSARARSSTAPLGSMWTRRPDSAARHEPRDGGLGEEPMGNADARVGGPHHGRLMDVDPGVGEHLVGQLSGAARVGEAWEAVAAQAAGEREFRRHLRVTRGRVSAGVYAAAREQVLAGRQRGAERGRLRLEGVLVLAGLGAWVGKVANPV
jgi:hypothetical protein